jgi:hypothetical protein
MTVHPDVIALWATLRSPVTVFHVCVKDAVATLLPPDFVGRFVSLFDHYERGASA